MLRKAKKTTKGGSDLKLKYEVAPVPVRNDAALIIQLAWRAYVARKAYKKLLEDRKEMERKALLSQKTIPSGFLRPELFDLVESESETEAEEEEEPELAPIDLSEYDEDEDEDEDEDYDEDEDEDEYSEQEDPDQLAFYAEVSSDKSLTELQQELRRLEFQKLGFSFPYEEVDRYEAATVVIQHFWRGVLARRKRDMLRLKKESRQYVELQEMLPEREVRARDQAARVLQRIWRKKLAVRQARKQREALRRQRLREEEEEKLEAIEEQRRKTLFEIERRKKALERQRQEKMLQEQFEAVRQDFKADEFGDLEVAFQVFSQDNCIRIKQLSGLMSALGQYPTPKELEHMIAVMDPNETGTISFQQFVVWYNKRKSLFDSKEIIHELFSAFDTKRCGFIDAGCIVTTMNQMKVPITMEEAEEMIRSIDIHYDGQIGLSQFSTVAFEAL